MGVLIVVLEDDQYVKWSNTTDAPVSHVMGRDELIENLQNEEHLSLSGAVHLVAVCDGGGTSDPDVSLEHLLQANRAGLGGRD